jgi:uncharacterized protein (DUF302 family)
VNYGTSVETALPCRDAVERVKSLLKTEGFGVLREIDVDRTLLEKTGEAFRPYVILGACNPALARRAITQDPQLSLLLPCNVVVQELEGKTVVSAIDPHALLGVTGEAALAPTAGQVAARWDAF